MPEILLCAIAVSCLLAAEWAQWRPGIAVAKLTASSAFVWAALSWGALETRFGQLIVLGLALCWLGDALLTIRPGQTLWFQLGIAAFLSGHMCYAAASLVLGVDVLATSIAALLVVLVTWRTIAWLGPHVPDAFVWPVRAYLAVIGAMVVATLGAAAAGAPWILAAGAIGFAASDVSVARERFVLSEFRNSAWGLPAYFGSQLAIAYAVAKVG